MHGIGTNQDKISAGSFQAFGGIAENLASFFPISGGLTFFYLIKLHTVKNDFRRMKPAQPLFNFLVYDLLMSFLRFLLYHHVKRNTLLHTFHIALNIAV